MIEDVVIVLVSFFLVAGMCTYYYSDIRFQDNAYKWIIFALLCLAVVVIEILMMIYRSTAKNILFIGNLIQILDGAALLLVTHLSKKIVYFSVAIFLIVWVATLVIYFKNHLKNLKKFEEQKNLDEERKIEQQQVSQPAKNDEKDIAKSSKNLNEVPLTSDHSNSIDSGQDEEDSIHPTNNSTNHSENRIKDIDLMDAELKDFDISNFEGLKRVFNASKQGLQLMKQGDDYIAVYCNSQGFRQIKRILSKNSIDISQLKAQAEIVTFNKEKIKVVPITEYLKQFKRS